MRTTFQNYHETVNNQEVLLNENLKLETDKSNTLATHSATLTTRENDLYNLKAELLTSAENHNLLMIQRKADKSRILEDVT